MRRSLVKLGLFLLAGAIVNVFAAWGLALCPVTPALTMAECIVRVERNELPLGTLVMRRIGEIEIRRSLHGPGLSLTPLIDESEYQALVPDWSSMADARLDHAAFQWFRVRDGWRGQVEYACGWPCLALRMGYRHIGPRLEPGSLFISVPVGLRTDENRWQLPVSPIWPGFAINTIFYAAILWLLFAAPFKVLRWRRITRGLCPACAYPVGTSPTCTECGMPVRSTSAEAVA